MKKIYFLGIIAFMILTIGSASAVSPLYLTQPNADYNGPLNVKVQLDYSGNTMKFTVIEPKNQVYDYGPNNRYTVSNVELKSVYIKVPESQISAIGPASGVYTKEVGKNGDDRDSMVQPWGLFETTFTKPNNLKIFTCDSLQLSGITVDELIAREGTYFVAAHVSYFINGVYNGVDVCYGPSGKFSIPEFPTIAVPVAAILGIMIIFGRRNKE